MLTLQRRYVIALAAVCLCGLAQESLLVAAEVPAERRLPPGTTVFFSIPDATEAHSRFMQTSFGQMMQDEAFEPIREDLLEWWEEKSEELEDELGVTPEELLNLIHGELAFAVVQPPGKDLGAVAFVEFGDQQETLDTLLGKFQESAEEQAERSVQTIEGTEVTTYLFEGSDEDEDADEGGGGVSWAYFIKDQYLVLALAGKNSTAGIIEEVLIRWDGEHRQTFADDPAFGEVMLKCQAEGGDDPQGQWYFNPIGLFQSALTMPQAAQAPVPPAMIMGYVSMLGIDKLKAMGGTSTLMTDKFDSVSRTFISVGQPASGVLNVFAFPATDQQPPRWVPEAATAYSSFNWDAEGAYKAVDDLVSIMLPPGTLARQLNDLAERGPKIHIKKDVIDAMTGRIQVLGETRDNVDVAEAAVQPTVIAIELSNETRMHDVLQRVSAALGDNLKLREFRDVKIYEVEIPNVQGGPPQSMGLAVARGQLFFATDVELLEGYLRDQGVEEPLANSADYRRVAAYFPAKTSMLGFGRTSAQFKPLYDMLKSGQLEATFPEVDFTKLPEFDQIAKYFNLTGSYAVPEDGGAMIVQFGLHRD